MYKRLAAVILCTCCFTTLPALADGWIFGGKLAYFEVDAANADDPDNAGLVLGYDWSKKYGILGIQGDVTTTFEDGSVNGETISVDTLGVFATYKTKGLAEQGLGIYLLLKGGALYYDLSVGSTTRDETDPAYGIGVGVNMGYVSFELDYTKVDDFEMVSFSVLF